MVTVEQIRILENRIAKACDLIVTLKRENTALKRAVDSSQTKMQELERFINQFKNEQAAIESGILSALKKLDELEDDISENPKDGNAKATGKEQPARSRPKNSPNADEEVSGIAIASRAETEKQAETESNDGLKDETELDIF